jgi:hypothetical protein
MTGATALQSNILILRCSASERGGTSSFASQLIGQREVIRTTESRSTQPLHFLPTVSHTEHVNIEYAVLDSEIEQLPDLRGFLKLASTPFWRRVALSPPESRLETEQLSHVRTLAARAWELFRGHSGAASQAGRSAGEEGMARRRYASGAKGGRAPDTIKLGLLMEAAHAQQALAQTALEKLNAHVRELDTVVRDEIRHTLVEELQIVVNETKRSAEALRRLRRSANLRVGLWSLVLTLLCSAIPLLLAWWFLPSPSEVSALRAKRDDLASAVARLEQRGAVGQRTASVCGWIARRPFMERLAITWS